MPGIKVRAPESPCRTTTCPGTSPPGLRRCRTSFSPCGRGGLDIQVKHVGPTGASPPARRWCSARGVSEEHVCIRLARTAGLFLERPLTYSRKESGWSQQLGEHSSRGQAPNAEKPRLTMKIECRQWLGGVTHGLSVFGNRVQSSCSGSGPVSFDPLARRHTRLLPTRRRVSGPLPPLRYPQGQPRVTERAGINRRVPLSAARMVRPVITTSSTESGGGPVDGKRSFGPAAPQAASRFSGAKSSR